MPLPHQQKLRLHIYLDHSSIELFINDGDYCMSSRFYPTSEQRSLTLFAENGAATFKTLNCWQLSSAWPV